MGMSLAIMLMLATFGSSAFVDVNSAMPDVSGTVAMIMGLLLLLGACGKSAQVPLQSWLLDAMEGPTPVSALIHAATMVTAVYLITRSNAVFAESEAASTAVVVVGTVTLLVGAWIGCAKDDIKRVLAGSTMSQIGYMMLAAGIGPAGYAYAIFLLLTHGFFKADMFLGAGSVMHATNDEVDMRHYGALRRLLPVTFVTFAAGIWRSSGSRSSRLYAKDHIIEVAFEQRAVVGALAMLGAGITAFYMTRLMLMTFYGAKRWRQGVHPHESPPVMLVPWCCSESARRSAGWFSTTGSSAGLIRGGGGPEETPSLLHFSTSRSSRSWCRHWCRDQRVGLRTAARHPADAAREPVLPDVGWTQRSLRRRAQRSAVHASRAAAHLGARRLEDVGIDGTVNSTASAIGQMSSRLRRVQNGFVRSYALTMTLGAAIVGVVILLGRLG